MAFAVSKITDKRKQEVLKDVGGTLSFTPYLNNQPAIASSATVQVNRPDGTALVAANTAATVDSTSGLISYALSAGNSATLGENYMVMWTFTVSTVVYYETILFDIVKHKFSITVVDSDLLELQSDLMSKNESFADTVGSSTSTTLVANNLKNYEDNYWNGGQVEVVLPSTGVKQTRTVTGFTSSTGTLTVSPAWTTNPDTSYDFIVRRGFQKKIEQAFDEILYELRGKGNRPALILESSDLHLPLLKKAMVLICRDFSKDKDDRWDSSAKEYEAEYIDHMNKLVVQYDLNEDGTIAGFGTEKDKNASSIRLSRVNRGLVYQYPFYGMPWPGTYR